MRVSRWLLGLTLLLAVIVPAQAQQAPPTTTKTLTSATCPGTGCLIVGSAGYGGLGVQVSGTFSATIVFEGIVSGDTTGTYTAVTCTPWNSTTGVTSTTAAGLWGCPVGGLSFFRVRVSSYTSGSAVVTTLKAPTLARGSGGGGSPGGALTSLQYNNGGAFGGFGTWDATTLEIPGGYRALLGGMGRGIVNATYGSTAAAEYAYDAGTYYGLVQMAAGANPYGVYNEFLKTRSTNGTTRATALTNDTAMVLTSYADDGTDLKFLAKVSTKITGAVGGTNWPGQIDFSIGTGAGTAAYAFAATGATFPGTLTIEADQAAAAVRDVTSQMCGRLTLESGVPVSSTDQTSKTTIYYTPYGNCNTVTLYNGTTWTRYSLSELSLALGTLTSGKNYDVWLYSNSGTLTLELSAAWTDDTTRADAITTQNGVTVKSGSTGRRLVGTIRTTSTTTTEDSKAKRFVANVYNRKKRSLISVAETADNWSYTTATWRQTNANAANQLMYVVSVNDEAVHAHVRGACYSASNVNWAQGIGVNSTSTNSAPVFGTNIFGYFAVGEAEWDGLGSLGYNYLAWLEKGATGCSFYGDAGTTDTLQFGINGWVVN